MKRIMILFSFAVASSLPAFGQSSMVFDVGTNIEVTGSADICAEVVTINGTFSGDGTQCGAPLPITLISFTAQANPHGAGVVLEWVTASEINNYGFYVQCRLDSNEIFKDLPNCFVTGHGTTNEEHQYSFTHCTGVAGKYAYRLKQVDLDGTVHYPQVATLKSGQPSLAAEKPTEFSLSQNYPNPFNPSTTIRYGLPHKSAVQLVVFNTLGQQVATLVQEEREAGYHDVIFDGAGLSSGVYFYTLTAGSYTQTRKLLLLR